MLNSTVLPAAYTGSANPSRRAKDMSSQQLDALMSDSESDAGQDSDRDSDFHPGIDVSVPKVPSRSRGASINQSSSAMPTTSTHSHAGAVPILPKKGNASQTNTQQDNVPPPSRRGRKPSGLSRSAREAQRKLNHSIIEKARRTKINEALATLREMVPSDYGRTRDEEDDDEGADGYGKKTGKKGKKEEKEKEFKLEILVRTVSFMKDLLEKVRTLEAQQAEGVPSSRAQDIVEGKKRKYQYEEDSEHETSDVYDGRRQHKRHRGDAHERRPRSSISELLSAPSVGSSAIHEISEQPSRAIAASRLPSISSWLNTVTTVPLDSPVVMATSPSFRAAPDSYIDPQLRSSGRNTKPPESAVRHHSMTPTEHHSSYLPSPPPSTRIPPMTHGAMGPSDLPSTLHLGEAYNVDPSSPSAKDVRSSMGSRAGGPRTPDEDSAASMLLEISASLSPQTYPSSGSPNARSTVPSTSAERMSLSPPSLRLGASCIDVSTDEGGDEKHLTPPRLGPSVPVVQSTSNVRPVVRPCIATRTVDLGTSVPLVPQTPSSLLGMGGVERVMSRLGLGARVVAE